MAHQRSMPKRLASTAICTLNSPSDSTRMPYTTHRKPMVSPGWVSVTMPKAISSTPKARSYWKASRNRSRDRYPATFTAPNTIIPMPSSSPMTATDTPGHTNSTTPSTHSSTDMMMYPVLAARIGVTERMIRISLTFDGLSISLSGPGENG